MQVKICSVLLIAIAVSFSQNQVNISGTVKDNSSNAPVGGATVKLLGKNLASTTDANGAFSITSASDHIARGFVHISAGYTRFSGGAPGSGQ